MEKITLTITATGYEDLQRQLQGLLNMATGYGAPTAPVEVTNIHHEPVSFWKNRGNMDAAVPAVQDTDLSEDDEDAAVDGAEEITEETKLEEIKPKRAKTPKPVPKPNRVKPDVARAERVAAKQEALQQEAEGKEPPEVPLVTVMGGGSVLEISTTTTRNKQDAIAALEYLYKTAGGNKAAEELGLEALAEFGVSRFRELCLQVAELSEDDQAETWQKFVDSCTAKALAYKQKLGRR